MDFFDFLLLKKRFKLTSETHSNLFAINFFCQKLNRLSYINIYFNYYRFIYFTGLQFIQQKLYPKKVT